jgi:small-conductance mechanosensitive channel
MIQAATWSAPSPTTVLQRLDAVALGQNSLLSWLYAVGTLLFVCLLSRGLQAIVQARLKRLASQTSSELDDIVYEILARTSWYFHGALALVLARNFVELHGWPNGFVNGAVVVGFAVQLGAWAQQAVNGGIRIWSSRQEGASVATMGAGIRFVARLVIWAFVALFILSNCGVEIGPMIAGLGVGGVAAALALQGILGDLFAGLSMYFDRPFDIGDFVVLAPLRGNVTRIGLRTTRIRSLDGEELIVPNGDLVKSRIQNFARMKERRIVFSFGIEYGLPRKKLELARELAKRAMEETAGVRFDRCHFQKFGASSLDYECVYIVESPDYNRYMDAQERINLELYSAFERESIPFAFPTQTLHWAATPPAGLEAPPPSPKER